MASHPYAIIMKSIATLTAIIIITTSAASVAEQPEEIRYEGSIPPRTHIEIPYGPHERNVLDFWQAAADEPAPLVLVIHGGGWNGGSKEMLNRHIDPFALLDAGISIAAINYRLIPQSTETPPVKAPMHDAARALQFLRSKAAEWKIDPTRIGATGGSAGGCTSLWLAYRDDLADPESDDPVARQSTRLTCAAVKFPQTTLDPAQMKEWIPNSRYGGHAFGKKDFAHFLAERKNILPWIAEYSPYDLASKDDPPVALYYPTPPAMGEAQNDPTHSANFGVGLKRRCDELGIPCEFVHTGNDEEQRKARTEFLIRHLNKQQPAE